MVNHMFRSGRVPVACNQALVMPIFERGDKLNSTKYRPIAVTEPLMRLYAGMLNARLLDYTDSDELRANTQAGFRPGHSVLHQVFTLHHMMQRQQHHGSKLLVCLLDLKGAYDRVSRPLLCSGRHCSAWACMAPCQQQSRQCMRLQLCRYGSGAGLDPFCLPAQEYDTAVP